MRAKTIIESGKAILGIEFGSTRIKAVLIDTDNNPIAGCFPDRSEKSDKEKTDKASAKSAQRTKVIDLERITGKRVPQIGIASIQGRNIDGLVSGKNRK